MWDGREKIITEAFVCLYEEYVELMDVFVVYWYAIKLEKRSFYDINI